MAIISSQVGNITFSRPRDIVHNDCYDERQQPLSDTTTTPTSTMTGLPVNAYNILRTWHMQLPVARISDKMAPQGTWV